MQTKPVLYFAAPLFNEAERLFNIDMARRLGNWFHVYLPQRDGGLIGDYLNAGISEQDAVSAIFASDTDALCSCDVIFAILDGVAVDEGVAFELGFAYARGKACFGMQTDFRRNRSLSRNVMMTGSLTEIFVGLEEVEEWAQKFYLSFMSLAEPGRNVQPEPAATRASMKI